MNRTIIAYENTGKYLDTLVEDGNFAYGLIIGQPSISNTIYVVHLTRTKDAFISIKEPESEESPEAAAEFSKQVSSEALVHHLVSATRMICGSFFVIGVFAVGKENIYENDTIMKEFQTAIGQFKSALTRANFGHYNTLNSADKVIMFYSSKTKEVNCQAYNEKSGQLFPVEWKFVNAPGEWYLFESSYDFDDVFPIKEKDGEINLEECFGISFETFAIHVGGSEIFFQSEKLKGDLALGTYLQSKNLVFEKKPIIIKASVFFPELFSTSDPVEVKNFQGTVKYYGTIASRVWSHPENSFHIIENFIRNDILRSLAARIQIYCDSMTETSLSKDVFVSELPRRVFFDFTENMSIQYNEYLFRNETPNVVVEQAKEILDVSIECINVFMNYEGVPVAYDDALHKSDSSNPEQKSREISKYMYLTGITVALIALVVSMAMSFIFR